MGQTQNTDQQLEAPVAERRPEAMALTEDAGGKKKKIKVPKPPRVRLAWSQLAGVVTLSCLISSFIGGGAGYYFAMTTPVQPQIAVFDVDGAARLAIAAQSSSGVDADKFAAKVTETMKSRIKQIGDLGIVVVDKASVVHAPEEVIIDPSAAIASALAEMLPPEASKAPSKNTGANLNRALGK